MKQHIVADAASFANDLKATGHVAVYGIYFDTGKSVLKPESKPALEEVAKLLKGDAALKLWVVGHTDSVGKVDDNMKLAQARAEAVAAELVVRPRHRRRAAQGLRRGAARAGGGQRRRRGARQEPPRGAGEAALTGLRARAPGVGLSAKARGPTPA